MRDFDPKAVLQYAGSGGKNQTTGGDGTLAVLSRYMTACCDILTEGNLLHKCQQSQQSARSIAKCALSACDGLNWSEGALWVHFRHSRGLSAARGRVFPRDCALPGAVVISPAERPI